MAQMPRHVEVKRSLIADAGMGLFAKEAIRKGKRIGRYRGTIYSRLASNVLPLEELPYLMEHLGDDVLNGYRIDNHMRWANHSSNPNAYSKLYQDGVIWFKALRDIEAGEEIYIDYDLSPDDRKASLQRCKELGITYM
jgi:SET domain-containing protein